MALNLMTSVLITDPRGRDRDEEEGDDPGGRHWNDEATS